MPVLGDRRCAVLTGTDTDECSDLTDPAALADVPPGEVAEAVAIYAHRLALGVDATGAPLSADVRADLALHGLAAATSVVERITAAVGPLLRSALAAGAPVSEVSAALAAKVSAALGAKVSAALGAKVSEVSNLAPEVSDPRSPAGIHAGRNPCARCGYPRVGDLPAVGDLAAETGDPETGRRR